MAARFQVPDGADGSDPGRPRRVIEKWVAGVGGLLSLVAAGIGLVSIQTPAAVVVLTAPSAPPSPMSTPMPMVSAAEPHVSAPTWSMPDLVGRNLQDAQDTIQALTGNRIFLTASHDATGAGREQVLDRNWRVCDQNMATGSMITIDTVIDFGAVKLTESC